MVHLAVAAVIEVRPAAGIAVVRRFDECETERRNRGVVGIIRRVADRYLDGTTPSVFDLGGSNTDASTVAVLAGDIPDAAISTAERREADVLKREFCFGHVISNLRLI